MADIGDITEPAVGGGKVKEPKDAKRREQILVASGVGVLILTFVLIRRSSSASSGTSATSASVDPTTGVPYAQELAQAASAGSGQGSGDLGLSSDDISSINTNFAGISSELADLSSQISAITPTSAAPTGGTSLPSGTQTGISYLPYVGPGSMPNVVTGAQATAGEFTQVGQEVNGVYSGSQVAGGVPLFGQFGTGYFQGFGLKGGPNATYTGPVFAPTSDKAYVGYTGPVA